MGDELREPDKGVAWATKIEEACGLFLPVEVFDGDRSKLFMFLE